MERYDWTQLISKNIFLLRVLGLCPKDDTFKFNAYTCYSVVLNVTFTFFGVFFEVVNLYFIRNDLDAITDASFVLFNQILSSLKVLYFANNIRTFKEIVVVINSDIFQPKSRRQIEIFAPRLRLWGVMFKILFFICAGTVTFLLAYPILDGSYKQFQLPLKSWYPFDMKKSPNYEIVYLHQVGTLVSEGMFNNNFALLIAAFNVYAISQMNLLCDNIRHLELGQDFYQNFIRCVTHHNEIKRFVDNYNRVFDVALLLQFFVSAVSLGFCMFLLGLVAPFTNQFYSLVFYGSIVVFEFFIYSWFGNEIVTNSSAIFDAVFESKWEDFPLNAQKCLLILLANTQKSIKVSAMNLLDFNLENFAKILKTAYSYFALLQQVTN